MATIPMRKYTGIPARLTPVRRRNTRARRPKVEVEPPRERVAVVADVAVTSAVWGVSADGAACVPWEPEHARVIKWRGPAFACLGASHWTCRMFDDGAPTRFLRLTRRVGDIGRDSPRSGYDHFLLRWATSAPWSRRKLW